MRSESPRLAVLGPVRLDGRDPGGPMLRALLVALALEPSGAPRSVDALSADLWGDDLPQNPKASLQSLVSRARAAGDGGIITTLPGGYALERPRGENHREITDARSDLDLAREVADRPVGGDRREREPADRVQALDAALMLWTGEPGRDLGDSPVAEDLRVAAAGLHDRLRTERARALATTGRADDLDAAARELRSLLTAHPLDERRHVELMELLAHAGRAADALAVYAEFRTRLRDELGASPSTAITELNARILRGDGGLDTPRDRPGSTPAPAAAAGGAASGTTRRALVRIGLPVALSPLIGRDSDIDETSALLRTHRLVTVLGAGGLGKTRLAAAVATASDAPSVVFVPLAGARESADVLPAIGGALGISETTTSTRLADARAQPDLRQRVLSALGERDTLLVLDNCEQVVSGVASWAAEALASVPGLRILTTSRTPLALAAEVCRPLDPLAYDEVTGSAVRLFVERARAVRPGADLPLEVVARLCARLDGLPLAIELAAARIRTMSPAQIEARLEDRFALLTVGDRAAPERHRTLQAVIEWSWELLEPVDRRALAMLSVLPGGLSLETANGVLRSDGVCASETEVDEVLDRLVSQSLLVVFEDAGSGTIRFRMLETVREFGLARLRLDGIEDAAWDAVLAWGRGFADARSPGIFALPGSLGAPAYRIIRAEQDNLLAALRRAVLDDRRSEAVLLLGVLAQSWTVRGAFTEFTRTASEVFDTVARAARRTDGAEVPSDALALCLATCAVGLGGTDPGRAVRAIALLRRLRRSDPALSPLWQGVSHMLESGLDADATRAELETLRSGPDADARLFAEMLVAQLAENDGEPETARIAAERTWRLATSADEPWIAAMAAHSLAQLASQSARPAEALHWLDIGTAGFEDFGAEDEMGERGWLRGLALISLGRADEAEAMFRDLTGAVDRTDDGMGLASIGWFGIAEIERSRGRFDDAILSFGRAISEFRESDQRASPWYLIALAGYVSAACIDDSLPPAEQARLAAKLRSRTIAVQRLLVLQRLRSVYVDRPVLGTALTGWSSWAIGIPELQDRGLEALALAELLGARQDQPCLALELHRVRAARLVGADAVERARTRARALSADERVPRAFTVLGAPVPPV
ncbi:hypothetical protein BMH32_05005 [Leucobacter sp. OLJS4]|uniref:AfsR/SARP family transcriptional regulator n=1 Tax=unclassified Leucobacter TaxID=2621730 RepID=UPI000C1A336E|nr:MULTISPECIES: BTAD domain-containing putative transcriptional regulator [unclassified Leucobacter]PII81509.1 hypothetical protein BMH25_13315 [Leucobacter sp. OLCALW19]PII86180.1 hypothetical protein BMH26_13735 [Leucobacter sp. OLTLW20]PII90075.1 hypothetical protein BMH27_11900 [Leucobacter sp. OLAS13]PII97108.1 hypothetical protein BMH29_12585 [Leucobacter sp. OLDS2]PIJ02198.1 hypothetical protein BMH31_12295 [Leucobacter sp. OLIS6]